MLDLCQCLFIHFHLFYRLYFMGGIYQFYLMNAVQLNLSIKDLIKIASGLITHEEGMF